MLKTQKITYQDSNVTLEGFYAYDDSNDKKRPAVLVAHDWSGRNEFADKKAQQLAELGYVGFALDMYGQGIIGKTVEEKSALIQPFMQDRAKIRARMLAALATVRKLDPVETSKIGAIGFCFGGLCVLDLARSGADVKGVVSFHGLLHAPENVASEKIKASILALHGFDDPMVLPDKAIAFGEEMTKAKADWQLDIYGNTMHAFMNPEAHDTKLGTVYNQHTEKRAWLAMKNFFQEVL